jgi:phosphoribosylanthranilate isomerase
MVKVKVCGVKNTLCVPILNELTPDYVGFILTSGFKRSINFERAAEIKRELSNKISTVGVFVNEDIERIAKAVKLGIIDIVQLHGDEDEKYISELKKICDVPVIKAVGVVDGCVQNYPKNCDCILLDYTDKTLRGGSGKRVEWKKYNVDKPLILAGGITPENVAEAIREVKPFAVDCSSGVETDGEKDEEKIERYILNARQN